MGQHHKSLVCAVAAVALAADVAQEYEELARRRLRKVGVVFLEDDDAVNIQCCPVCNSTSESGYRRPVTETTSRRWRGAPEI